MNKLFSKVAALSVGLAMAIGVGVAVGSKSVKEVRAESETTWTASEQGFSNEQQLAGNSYNFVDASVSVTFNALVGNNGHKYYNSGSAVRSYGGESFTISCSTGNLTSITLSNNQTKEVTADVGTYSSNSWTGSAASVTFTVASGSGNFRTSTITAVFEGSGPSVTYTINYNSNGGSGTMDPTTGSNPSVAACTFTAPNGKVFSKWNTAANGSGTDYAAGDKPGKDLSLYAIWAVSESILIEASSTDQLSISPWSVDNTPSQCETTNLSRGWQWSGGTSAVITYTSSQAFKKVVVGASTNGASTSLAVAVGGVAFGDSQSVTSGTAAARTDYTFEGTGEGNVVITLTNTASKSAYINKIELFFDDGPDPSKDTLVVKLNDNLVSPQTVNYTPVSGWLFYANDKDGNDINSDWESSDESVFTVSKNGNNVAVVKPHDIGTATLTASADGYNSGSFVLTIVPGTVEEIVVTGSMSKTSYYVGESWSHDGLVATATYDTMYEKDVSEEAAWTYSPASPALNVTSVVATATLGTVSGNSSAQTVSVSRTNPIQVLYTKSDNTDVNVYGVYVGFLDGTGPVIMDGAYGMVCYNKTADVSGYTAGTTILHVTGKMGTYHGLRQITSPVLSVASGTYDTPDTPVVYATNGNETAEYASRLTTVTGVPSVTGTFPESAGSSDITITMTIGPEKTVQVFYKKAAQEADADAYAAMKAAVEGSSEITVKGFTGWHDGFQVQMNGYIPPAEGYTAEDFAQDLLDQTDGVCAGWEEGVNNHDALEAIWSNLASNDKYPSLPAAQKTILAEAERDEEGTVVEQAMARYDFLTGKYNLSNFINGRTPVSFAFTGFDNLTETNNTMIIVISIATVSALAFTLLLVFKKKKQK